MAMDSIRWMLRSTAAVLMIAAFCCGQSQAAEPDRYYVGERACRQCHRDKTVSGPFNVWRVSAHSKAFAALAKPSSSLKTSLSGLATNAMETPVCLGCHTTAPGAEAWQKDPGFRIEDGVQCELCHGPGSDYAVWEVMKDPASSEKAGLVMPDERTCRNCHQHKGSHKAEMVNTTVVFHHPEKGKDYFDYPASIKRIAHRSSPSKPQEPLRGKALSRNGYVGAAACGHCHDASDQSFCYSKWRLSQHADAYAVLGTDKGIAKARTHGISGTPQSSAVCLECHMPDITGADSFDFAQGIQCEHCHGPGRDHTEAATENGKNSSWESRIRKPDSTTCTSCHRGFHGRSFDPEPMLKAIDHTKKHRQPPESQTAYKTPFNLTVSRDGSRIFIACEGSDSLIIADTNSYRVLGEIPVMNLPHGVCLSPDERLAYVSNRGSDTVSVVDISAQAVVATIAVGDEPHDLILDSRNSHLLVANTGSYDISVVDLDQGKEIRRLAGGRGTWGMSRCPDTGDIFVTNNLSHLVGVRESSRSEVTVVDGKRLTVKNRIMVRDANLIQGIDFAPDGSFALVTLLRTKNLVPIVRVIQGWMITNGFGILWKDGRVDQLLIDGIDNYFADPTDIAVSPDGALAFVTGGGVDEVAVIDIRAVQQTLEKADETERSTILPNHLGVSEAYVKKRIAVGKGPRGLSVSPDGSRVYVADALDDTVSVIDTLSLKRIGVIDLGGPGFITQIRRGERIFHNADITYGRQYTCHSCHPDGGIDGLTYDIAPDGLGFNPVDNRTLRGILDTAPFKWTGKNPSLSRQCGPRLAVFFTRIDPFTPEQARDLESYICTIPRNPNRFRTPGDLTPAQRRGKALFFRTKANDGSEIPVKDRCDTCHSGPYYTNRQVFDVGTASPLDTNGRFDVPHLNNIYETPPYLHDGSADTLEEIWTVFNPDDKHGITNDMTKDQLNDLIEYLKML